MVPKSVGWATPLPSYSRGQRSRVAVLLPKAEVGRDQAGEPLRDGSELEKPPVSMPVEAVAGRVPVVVDGGFMRGADVVKGLCLGATAVAMGRFEGLSVAAGGSAALLAALKILEHDTLLDKFRDIKAHLKRFKKY